MLSRFHLIPERYGRTDRQTDRFAISISRVSMLTRDKNWLSETALQTPISRVSVRPHYGNLSGRHGAAWQPRACNPQDYDLGCLEATGWTQESLAFLDAAVQLLLVQGTVCQCTVLLDHKSLPDTLHIAGSIMTSLRRREAASKMSVRDITRISCFVRTMK